MSKLFLALCILVGSYMPAIAHDHESNSSEELQIQIELPITKALGWNFLKKAEYGPLRLGKHPIRLDFAYPAPAPPAKKGWDGMVIAN